jgi:hypothetical protein
MGGAVLAGMVQAIRSEAVSRPHDQELAVYTCITAGYDDLPEVTHPEAGVTYVCFMEGPATTKNGWQVRPLPQRWGNPVLDNRFVKMHPHLLFPDHPCSVYVDGNVLLKQGVRDLAQEALRSHDLALYAHPFRNCIYQEAEECARIGHDWLWAFERQMRRYRAEGMPPQNGLFECNVLFRRHHAPAVAALMEAWWHEFLHGVRRDQLSLPHLLHKHAFSFRGLGKSGIRKDNPHFGVRIYHNHGHAWRDLRGHMNSFMLWLAGRRRDGAAA